ncbi:putative cytochrome P450 [Xylariales sp. PMI_506]|nr:putative cytochrome P450 [Xylariales sp. PMI_506]
MLLDSLSVAHSLVILVVVTSVFFAYNRYQKGLARYPGPLIASFTNLWRLFVVWGRHAETKHISLHRKYGDVVRLGPNFLSFGSAAAIKDIYGLNKGFIKSEFYPIQQGVANGRVIPSLFGTQDEQFHSRLRRCVNGAFSMTSLIQYEQSVNMVVRKYLSRTDSLFSTAPNQFDTTCDFARWLQFFAFDVIGTITYTKDHGFIDRNEDIDGIAGYMAGFFDYAAIVGQIPILDRLLWKNPILSYLNKLDIASTTGTGAVNFAKARMAERLSTPTKEIAEDMPTDLLNKFLKAQQDHPEFMDDRKVLAMALSMTFAGSETTGITLGAIFYYILKNPRCYSRLIAEISVADRDGSFEDDELVSFAEANQLRYLDACIKEAFRIFPAAGLHLERIVPKQGAVIAGHRVPGGTIVGCTPWVLHRDPSVFGADADEFRPERWLDDDQQKIKMMNASMVHFGSGARTCLGKNISLLEIYKLVPSFLRKFDLEFANHDQGWRTHNAWFVRQMDFNVKITRRSADAPV